MKITWIEGSMGLLRVGCATLNPPYVKSEDGAAKIPDAK